MLIVRLAIASAIALSSLNAFGESPQIVAGVDRTVAGFHVRSC
jgi:hypothetical protein